MGAAPDLGEPTLPPGRGSAPAARHPLRNRAVGLANSLRGMGQGAQPSYWDRLGDIAVPVLLIAGGLDRKFVGIAGQMGVRIADATLSVVPGAGHAVHLERPDEFLGDVREFIAKCERSGRRP